MNTTAKKLITWAIPLVVGLVLGALLFRGGGSNGQGQAQGAAADTEYTCSMHPQIRQQEPGKCPLCGMDLIPVMKGGGSSEPDVITMSATAIALAQITTARVEEAGAIRNLRLNGRVEADERKRYIQSAHVAGRVERLYVTFEGQYVNAGQAIAALYAPALVTAQEELLEALKYKESNPALVDAARQKLSQWRMTNKQIQELESSGTVLRSINITADAGGFITRRMVTLGDYVEQGAPLYELADLSTVWVVFDVYEADMPWIRTGDAIEFTVQSLPGQSYKAKVNYINPLLDEGRRVASVRTELANPGGRLKPGMFATGNLDARLATGAHGLVVPRSAVLWTGERSVVYVKVPSEEGAAFRLREVVLGPALGDAWLVTEGLEAGEEIVVSGTFTLDAAAELEGKLSMMQRGSSGAKFIGKAGAEFPENLEAITQAYITLKDHLVATDAAKSKSAAATLLEKLKSASGKGMEKAAAEWWELARSKMMTHATRISTTGDVEEQRRWFDLLSNELIATEKAFGTERMLYVQYCPMAFDDRGAYWMSTEERILNPYFGDKMLRCGTVEEVLGKTTEQRPRAPQGHVH